jgi:hypothetical protein
MIDIEEETQVPDRTVNNNREAWIPRTWSEAFNDDEPDDHPQLIDPNGWLWHWDDAADGWVNDHEAEEAYEWAAALFEVDALREVQA